MKITKIDELENIAKNVRINLLKAINSAKSGHPGGSLSCTDILTVLYFNEMNIEPTKPNDNLRDRLVLSKGHASAALYATLAERGYFPKEELSNLRNIHSMLQGHPDMNKVPGVDMTTGSLGQGLSIANGMAIASKMDRLGNRIYCLLGDGEIQEGQVWEAAMTASKYNLDNVCAIIDCNDLQLTGRTEDIKNVNYESVESKFRSFGFHTIIINGNNIESIMEAFSEAEQTKGVPTAIIARTIKGKGVSFMEGVADWHGKALNDEELEKAIKELEFA